MAYRIDEIINIIISQDSVDEINTANGTSYTVSDVQEVVSPYLKDESVQGLLGYGLQHKQQVYTLISIMYNLLQSAPNSVEANKIYAGMQAIATVFVTPYGMLTSDDTTPTEKDYTLVKTILGIEDESEPIVEVEVQP